MLNYDNAIAVSEPTERHNYIYALLNIYGRQFRPNHFCWRYFRRHRRKYENCKIIPFITEACEYTNTFLEFNPKRSIILNIDLHHLTFKDIHDIRNSFRLFAKRLLRMTTLYKWRNDR